MRKFLIFSLLEKAVEAKLDGFLFNYVADTGYYGRAVLDRILVGPPRKTKSDPKWVAFASKGLGGEGQYSSEERRTDRLYSFRAAPLSRRCVAPCIVSRCARGAICAWLACASTDSLKLDYVAYGSTGRFKACALMGAPAKNKSRHR